MQRYDFLNEGTHFCLWNGCFEAAGFKSDYCHIHTANLLSMLTPVFNPTDPYVEGIMKTIRIKIKKEDIPKRRAGIKPSKVEKSVKKYNRKKANHD